MPTSSRIAAAATPMKVPLGERTINFSSCHDSIVNIFNSAQHVTSTDSSLAELKKLYRNTSYNEFISSFKHCLRNLMQSSQENKVFFATSCDFVCNFLQYVSDIKSSAQSENNQLSSPDHAPTPPPPPQPNRASKSTRANQKRASSKRKQFVEDDELVALPGNATLIEDSIPAPLETYVITNHDRLMSTVVLDIVNQYMQSIDDDCRCNSVIFTAKLLSVVQLLDLEICNVLKTTLPKRMRDKKALIRAHAVLASRTFQDCKLIRDAIMYHFERDPEPIVRKALIQVMDTKVFKYGFLIDSTRDSYEPLRKVAYQRLGNIDPMDLSMEERHKVIRNGLNERCRQLAYVFRSRTLEPWTKKLYDRTDLLKLFEAFDVINYTNDMERLVNLIYMEDLENIQPTGTTKLHMNVEWLRQNLLDPRTRLPSIPRLNERSVFIWLTILNFCKKNSAQIQPIKLTANVDANTSIERLIDNNENGQVEEIDLYERLSPDLVTLCEYIKTVIDSYFELTKNEPASRKRSHARLEFVYQQLMGLLETYEVADELERRTVQEVFRIVLKENLLTEAFNEFITPIIRCLAKMIYKTSPNLMVSWISDMINDVRSNLEDLNIDSHRGSVQQAIAKSSTPFKPRDGFVRPSLAPEDIELKIAQLRVDLAEADDECEKYKKENNFDEAKKLWQRISDIKVQMKLWSDRRNSIAFSDIGHDGSYRNSISAHVQSLQFDQEEEDEVQLFKHHYPELVKCLQMFAGCLQYCELNEVPTTMSAHLTLLSLEGLKWGDDTTIKSLVLQCTGLTALISKDFAHKPGTISMLKAGCDPSDQGELIEVKTKSYRCLVDVLLQHKDIELSDNDLDDLFGRPLREYIRKDNPKDDNDSVLDYRLAIIEGATKLIYFEKLMSPDILSNLILWWYHPRTHSRVKQYIGVFLPVLVEDLSIRSEESKKRLCELLEKTFLIGVESLHDYILGPGYQLMSASDMYCMIRFMCSLIPVPSHVTIATSVALKIRELSRAQTDKNNDLCGYLIGAFASLDVRKGSVDYLDDLEDALSDLEQIVDRLGSKNKQLKSQYTKFRGQVSNAERLPDSPRKRLFDELQSTMIENPCRPAANPANVTEIANNDDHDHDKEPNNKTVAFECNPTNEGGGREDNNKTVQFDCDPTNDDTVNQEDQIMLEE